MAVLSGGTMHVARGAWLCPIVIKRLLRSHYALISTLDSLKDIPFLDVFSNGIGFSN